MAHTDHPAHTADAARTDHTDHTDHTADAARTEPDDRAAPAYDKIGIGYGRVRRPDRRLERRIHERLPGAGPVINVGAGTGSYEPTDRPVVAVEPSLEMIRQRPAVAAPVVRATADQLPFAGRTFDAGMALLTVHHWPDPVAGLTELRRVTRGPVVIFTFEHGVHADQWLIRDYLPEMADLDTHMPSPSSIADALGGQVETFPVPHDCTDGFCHAWWRRPEAYLDRGVRAGISGIARLPRSHVEAAMRRLADDLATGRWQDAHADLFERDEIDAGYRLVFTT